MMFSKSIHVVAHKSNSLLLWLSSIPEYGYNTFCSWFIGDEHLGCYHLFLSLIMLLWIFCTWDFFFFLTTCFQLFRVYIPVVELLWSYGNYLTYRGITKYFPWWLQHFNVLKSYVWEFQLLYILTNTYFPFHKKLYSSYWVWSGISLNFCQALNRSI